MQDSSDYQYLEERRGSALQPRELLALVQMWWKMVLVYHIESMAEATKVNEAKKLRTLLRPNNH